MRRQERQIDLARIKDVVESNHILRLGMLSEDYPYVVPVNYGYEWLDDQLVIYIHGARQGKKISSIKANPKVCIEMDHDSEMISGGSIAPDYSTAFSSVIGLGLAEIVTDLEVKKHALDLLMRHETGKGLSNYDLIPDQKVNATAIIKISIEKITGKAHQLPKKDNQDE